MNFISVLRTFSFFLRRYVGILFLLILLSACQNGGSTFTRFEDSPVIDRLLDSAPHLVVNTDLEPERWVATTRLGIQNDSLILGSPAHLLAVEDDIYVSELYGHDIFSIGNDGYLNRKVGSGGRAPGEFTYPKFVKCSHIFFVYPSCSHFRDFFLRQTIPSTIVQIGRQCQMINSWFHGNFRDIISLSCDAMHLDGCTSGVDNSKRDVEDKHES